MKENGKIKRLEWSNRGPAVLGDKLICRGRVVKKYRDGDEGIVECEVWIEKEGGENIVPGKAEVILASSVKQDA